jgi:hypothetical protein
MTLPVSPPPILETAGVDQARALEQLEAAWRARRRRALLERSRAVALFRRRPMKAPATTPARAFGLRV